MDKWLLRIKMKIITKKNQVFEFETDQDKAKLWIDNKGTIHFEK